MVMLNRIRTLALGAALALAVFGIPAGSGHVHAATSGCEAGTCSCTHNGISYYGGETISVWTNGKPYFLMCDGYSGTWVFVAKTATTGISPVPGSGGIVP